jgi:hypothetical protein
MNTIKIPAEEVLAGDTFVHQNKKVWTAVEDATYRQGAVHIRVQFCEDGGMGDRFWDDSGYPLTVERESASA